MAKSKPIIFISHVHEDAHIALCLKRFLDEAFLGVFNIFVSSDGASIRSGDNWSSSIEDALSSAEIVLALISEQARDRRWIYFECGGAYFARKRVIPICCRCFSIDALSTPLSWLQANDGTNPDSVGKLVQDIASTFDVHAPRSDISKLVRCLNGVPSDTASNDDLVPIQTGFAQRTLPIFLVVDTSGSMRGEPIENLSQGIRKLMDELLKLETGEVVPLISLITFGDDAKEVIRLSPITLESMDFFLSSSDAAALGVALRLLVRCPSGHLQSESSRTVSLAGVRVG